MFWDNPRLFFNYASSDTALDSPLLCVILSDFVVCVFAQVPLLCFLVLAGQHQDTYFCT